MTLIMEAPSKTAAKDQELISEAKNSTTERVPASAEETQSYTARAELD